MTSMPCPACGCQAPDGSHAHAVVAALVADDLDRALDAGLLQVAACPQCSATCRQGLLAARTDRLRALAARDRFRARQARLQARARAREVARTASTDSSGSPPATGTTPTAPSLPSAAAAALERAKARAAQRHKQ